MSAQQIKNYLTLVRFPNLFTLPSNVFAGYFSTHIQGVIEIDTIVFISVISACLYAAGVIFNDLADRQIDHHERPNRPIPSGRISQRNAIILGTLLLVISITVSYFISAGAFTVTLSLIAVILLYDFGLKNSFFGPAVMASTRVMNIILGSSPNLGNMVEGEIDYVFFRTTLICISEFIYVLGISILSKYETHRKFPFPLLPICASFFLSPLAVGVYAVSAGLFNDNTWIYLLIFGGFLLLILKVITFSKSAMTGSLLQKIIGLLIVGIIIHDSVYIGGSLDNWYTGMSTFVLLLPAILLGKRFYVT